MTDLIVHRQGAIARVQLNRPHTLNSITTELKHGLAGTFRALENNGAVAVIISGNERAFCSGADLRELDAQGGDAASVVDRIARVELTQSIFESIRCSRLATIAEVLGVAAGGGIALALACDVVVAADDARFVWGFQDRGLIPDGDLCEQLRESLGSRRATSLLLRHSELTASQMEAAGLVDEVLSPDHVPQRAMEIAERAASMGPTTTALLKRALAPHRRLGRAVEALAQSISLAGVRTGREADDPAPSEGWSRET